MKLPALSGERIISALQKAGWQVVTQRGSHVTLKHPEKPKVLTITRGREYRAILKKVLRQAGLTESAFSKLL